jgi:hypothetical protein
MKYLLLSAFCFAIAGCASSGGGDVVGNGLTGNPSRTQIMDTNEGSEEPACSAEAKSCSEHKDGSPDADGDCGCNHSKHHKAKSKAKKVD